MKPEEVHRSLHNATDWFAMNEENYPKLQRGNFIRQSQSKTQTYDMFLVNGQNQNEHPEFKPGDKVKLQIANGEASSYFWLNYAGGI